MSATYTSTEVALNDTTCRPLNQANWEVNNPASTGPDMATAPPAYVLATPDVVIFRTFAFI